MPFFAGVTVTLSPCGRTIEARTFDISLGGVGLICPTMVAVGQILSMAFRLADRSGGAVIEVVHGRVCHSRSDEGATTVGMQFLSPLGRRTTPILVARIEAT